METKVISNDIMFAEVEKFIAEGRSVEIRVKGNSMNPFLASGRDSIVLSPCSREEIALGSFILGRDSYGRWVAHRVVKICPDHIVLNGDGNFPQALEKMAYSDVLGIVSGYVRKGRRGSTSGMGWKSYSAFWRFAGWLRVGNLSLRRIYLALWRRLNSSYVLKTTENK